MTHRVVVTGQGAVTALGANVARTLDGLRAGRLGIGPLNFRDVDRLSVRIGAQIHDYEPEAHFSKSELNLLDRATQFAVLAAAEAVAAAGLSPRNTESHRCGVILGTAGGGLQTQDESFRAVYQDGKNRVHPLTVPRLMHNAAASQLSIRHGFRGPSYTVSTACASSNHAMGQAFHLIRAGAADAVLTGGAESMLSFGGLKAWEGLRVMSPDGCRPFSLDRNGMVQGEGAAVFVFEDYAHALARGAHILAEICGFSMNADASDIVLPSREGAEKAMAGALADAGLSPGDIDYINAHGTGTAANDRSESDAIRSVFGPIARDIAVSSTKSMHGHLIGATGAVELLSVVMAVREGMIAPTIGYRVPDPDCALDIVANAPRQRTVRAALSNAFAFGGLNAVLAVKSV